ncbi:MAG TPA: hypothetical protein VN048_18220 [Verrucomicrobiae bacterium]|nr:hypothetical protein [Verrucomicrobiae bacterium]
MPDIASQRRQRNPVQPPSANGTHGKHTGRKATAATKAKPTFASVFPHQKHGRPLPPELVKLIRGLEKILKMPVWMLIHNGDADFCCSSICHHTLRGFQDCRALVPEGKPVALLIHSPGGDAHHAYSVARFFQRRTPDFTVLVPRYAKSAATLLALGASKLILGRDAELGPLDVQMRDRDREEYGSALDAVQSLERLNAFSLAAIDQLMIMMVERTGKRMDTLLPLVFNYATSFVRPLLDKIDTVD